MLCFYSRASKQTSDEEVDTYALHTFIMLLCASVSIMLLLTSTLSWTRSSALLSIQPSSSSSSSPSVPFLENRAKYQYLTNRKTVRRVATTRRFDSISSSNANGNSVGDNNYFPVLDQVEAAIVVIAHLTWNQPKESQSVSPLFCTIVYNLSQKMEIVDVAGYKLLTVYVTALHPWNNSNSPKTVEQFHK